MEVPATKIFLLFLTYIIPLSPRKQKPRLEAGIKGKDYGFNTEILLKKIRWNGNFILIRIEEQ
jgi:hypothetical protein